MLRGYIIALLILVGLSGCNNPGPANPTFAITVLQANAALNSMRLAPKPLARPLVVLQGFLDPGVSTDYLRAQVRSVTQGGAIIYIPFLDCGNFDQCRRKVLDVVQKRFPSRDERYSVEVDVMGVSMGGLVGRYAAKPMAGMRQLRIARLFTIATPHRGASSASGLTLGSLASDMAPDSPFLRQLNSPPVAPGYELYPYVWLDDEIVGADNAAPPGMTPWWLAPLPLESPHVGSMRDARIIADIARRLRYETPYTVSPPAPLPAR